jgi:hypothetical protein
MLIVKPVDVVAIVAVLVCELAESTMAAEAVSKRKRR